MSLIYSVVIFVFKYEFIHVNMNLIHFNMNLIHFDMNLAHFSMSLIILFILA